MRPHQIKAEIIWRNTQLADIAKDCKVSRAMITRVIRRDSKSERIEKYIAALIGREHNQVFPDAA